MTSTDVGALAIVALVAAVPVAIVVLALIVRGYTVSLHMHRPHGQRRKDHQD